MMDFEALAARLWAAVAAVFFGVFCLSLATTAHARVFPECNPAAEAGKLYGAADADAWVKRICDAQESTYRTWEANLQKLDIGQQDLSMATNAGDWKAYRAKWAELLPVLKEMEAAALASRNAVGAANILSLYRSDLGLFLQNAGLGTAANLDEFSARISGGLDGQRPAAAATAGVNVVQQSVTRGVEFVKGLAAAEGDKVLAEYRGQVEQKAATRREQLSGNTASGYFGGFARRITEVWGIFFFVLFVLMLVAVVVAVKRKQNPITLAGAASLAYLLPGSAMVLAFVLVPFLPSWAMIAATLVGTYAMYAQGGRICGALASKLGEGSTLGDRLREPVRRILETVDAELMGLPVFDPPRSERCFAISTSDIGELVFLPTLLEVLKHRAPGATLRCHSMPPQELERAMADGVVDIALGYFPDLQGSSFLCQTLFDHPFSCIVRRDHPTMEIVKERPGAFHILAVTQEVQA